MKLYIMRHGIAESPGVNLERPLTEKGKQELKKLAAHLKKNNIVFPKVIHSPRLRACQTAEALKELVQCDQVVESRCTLDQSCYLEEAMEWIHESESDLLIIAHMPFISELVSMLTTGSPRYPMLQFLPGTIVCLEMMGFSYWVIDWVLHAGVLG